MKKSTSLFSKYVKILTQSNSIIGGEIYTKIQAKPIEVQLSFTSLDSNIKEGQTSKPSDFDMDYFFRGVTRGTICGISLWMTRLINMFE